MSNIIKGKITEILKKENGTSKAGKDWVKQTFAIDTGEQYNNIVAFEVFGDEKVENLNKYNKVGDVVEVEYNISSNKWKDKYFTSLQAWKITKSKDEMPEPAFEPKGNLIPDSITEDEKDLPF